jgi:hypothetical protein
MELLQEEITAIAEARNKKSQKELLVLRRKVAGIEAKELELADDLVEKSIGKDVHARLAGKYAAQRKEAEMRIAQLNVDYKDPLDFFDKAAFTATAIYELHKRFRFHQRRILLRAIFQTIWVQDRKIVGATLNPPFSLFLGEGNDGGSITLFGKPPPIGDVEPSSDANSSIFTVDSRVSPAVFEKPTLGGARKDIFEQLLEFTPSQEFLALMQLLEEFPDLRKTDRRF